MAEYIEREALLKELEMAIKCKDCPRNVDIITYYDRCACSEIGDICNAITEAPAADVQPVKRGKWHRINNEGFIYCSECHKEAYWDTDYGQQLFDYCPYCGAKMSTE